MAAKGYHQPYLRTGYEQIVAHRTSDIFAVTAKQPGQVISKTEDGIIVRYEDGEEQGVQLGRRYGKAEGSVYPHDILTPLNLNDKFGAGDCIAYNNGYFEPDFLDPKQVIMKNQMVVTTLLYETMQTHEDCSSISQRISDQLETTTTKIRSFVVDFKQGVKAAMKPGSSLTPSDVLFIIEDQITNESGLFDEETLQTLQRLSNRAPKAKVNGVLDRYEVFYHGDKEDMSPSLRTLANASDRRMAEIAKSSQQSVTNGRVNSEYRVSGTPLSLDQAEIKVYITIKTKAGVGDKGIFANQMKSVFGEVLDYEMRTESGREIDAIFGFRSIQARIVLSPMILGTTISLLKVIGRKAIEIYEK